MRLISRFSQIVVIATIATSAICSFAGLAKAQDGYQLPTSDDTQRIDDFFTEQTSDYTGGSQENVNTTGCNANGCMTEQGTFQPY
ncbi:MAG: hypothetical protein OHK0017_08350 [Patescibacteria group bacterium]